MKTLFIQRIQLCCNCRNTRHRADDSDRACLCGREAHPVGTKESDEDTHKNFFVVKKDTPQFGDIRTSQEETIKKTINDNIKLENDALRYYPDSDDLTLDGKIPALNLKFQFRYNDPSGDGVYLWSEALQLTDANLKVVGKLRNCFMNWRDSITQDAGLMEKLKQASQKDNV